ncbi:MAG: NAD(P)H-quinone oxidoreductase [Acetobacteraceae bacterium]
MSIVAANDAGAAEVLVPARRAVPAPGRGELLVEVAAVGINGPDIMQRKGLYPAPAGASDLLGLEIAGTVVALGEGAAGWSVGDRITGLTNGGGYAEYCTIEARHCLPIPQGVSLCDAAGLPETFFTVWSNIFMNAKLHGGEKLLVHGGAGGIGSTAIQLGKAFGATVYATDSPAARCEFCRSLGADRVIDYREEDFVAIVRKEIGGADVILDIVGGPYVEKNIKAAAHDARLVQLAFALGSKVEINLMPIMLKRLTYTGSTLRTRSAAFKARVAQELREQVWPKIAAGQIRVVSEKILPLSKAAEGHALMERASHTGKILLVPDRLLETA